MAVAALPRVYALSMKQLYTQVIADVRDGKAGTIHPELYRAYCENLRKGVSGVLGQDSYGDRYSDMCDQFEANVARFAAYKAFHATRQLEHQLADRDGVERSPEEFDRMARAVLNTFNRYQAAEYNTAVSRARTAKQWADFSQGDNMFLFPNLRWIPSRSANPREEHMPFYDLVLPKTDHFWTVNQPGTLWNCKCDWEETDDPVDHRDLTPDQLAEYRTEKGSIHAKGLEGNPAQTGQIFTDQCTYVKNSPQGTEKSCRKANRNMMAKQGREQNKSRRITYEIDGTEHEFDFGSFGNGKHKVDICHHYAASMFGDVDFWLKNEILLNPQSYFDNGVTIGNAAIDPHNSGAATQRLKDCTNRFFYIKTRLANGKEVILHVGRYKDSGKLYLYSASKELPEYARTPQ